MTQTQTADQKVTPSSRTDVKQLKVGDRLSRVSYVQVTEVKKDSFRIKNSEGLEWEIGSSIVAAEMFSAGQFSETREVNRTELIEALEGANDTIFTIVFEKQVDKNDVAQLLVDSIEDKGITLKEAKKLAIKLLTGEERRLVGYLASTEPKMGRSVVIDLEATGHNLRLVDHRTVKELILRNIRYVLK